jgi:hypothetical protein
MNNQQLLEKLSSNYILKNIFEYIKDIKFKFKLFAHSKLFQKILELKLVDYQLTYINQFGLPDMNTYFSSNNYSSFRDYDKNFLSNKLKDDISNKKIDINKIKATLVDIFKNYYDANLKKLNYDYFYNIEKKLDIYSPLFEEISKTDLFEKMYTIPVPIEIIDKLNLKNDYIAAFNKKNESNGKYPSLTVYYKECEDIKVLQSLNIDFNKVKRLSLMFVGPKEHINTNILFKDLFSIKNIENLTYLNLDLNANVISPESFEKINDLKSLKILKIVYLLFDKAFLFKLKGLECLKLNRCEKMIFDEDTFLNMKKLYIDTCYMIGAKALLKMPKLENCRLIDPDFTFGHMIDFSKMENLEELASKVSDFILLEKSKLESVELGTAYSEEDEKKMFEKIFSFKNLNKIDCVLKYMDEEEILKIKGENESVKDIYITWRNEGKDANFLNLAKKFPNLEIFSLESDNYKEDYNYTNIEIKEDENIKINDLTLIINSNLNLKLNCGLLENLIKFQLSVDGDLKDIEEILPVFNDKCQKDFKSLKTFIFSVKDNFKYEINMKLLEHIYNNLDKMPNLENLVLNFFVKGLKNEKEFYMKFIEKVISMKLFYINIKLFREESEQKLYSYKELKELYQDNYFQNLKQVVIMKFDEIKI